MLARSHWKVHCDAQQLPTKFNMCHQYSEISDMKKKTNFEAIVNKLDEFPF